MQALLPALAFGAALALLPLRPSGTVHEIRLSGNRFTPRTVEARAGDTLRFLNGAGGPHNIEFVPDSIGVPAQRTLEAALTGGEEKLGPLSSPLLMYPDQRYELVIPALPPGRYPFVCLPHQAGDMRGVLVVLP